MAPRSLLLSALAASSLSLANGASIQKKGLKLPSSAAANAQLVRNAFSSAFADYTKYAWGHDDLAPISASFVDSRNGWGATIVDAMTTMKVMGLESLFENAINFTHHIDFSKSQTSDSVSMFETTIRYLASMLSSYEMTGKTDKALLEQAVILGDKLAFGWVGNNTIPYNTLDFGSNSVETGSNNVAQIGTLTLEFSRLSLYSGNQTYKNLAENAVKAVIALTPPLPGLPAQDVDPASGKFVDDYVTWGGGTDSYLEYLVKYARLTNNADPAFINAWKTAVDSSIKYLATTGSVGNHFYLADYSAKQKIYIGSHLECFAAGNWIMGGKLLNNQTIVNYGLEFLDSCINTYQSDVTGIGPEVFAYNGTDGGSYTGGPAPSTSDTAFYNKHGFYVYDGYNYYDLRPEVMESNFYAWRATGDIKYYNNAVIATHAIFNSTKAPLAYAPINNVQQLNSGFIDNTESFFFAEVLKYLFLTFDDPEHISLDEYVFNTEAHPFLAPKPLSNYNPHTPSNGGYGYNPDFTVTASAAPAVVSPGRSSKGINEIYSRLKANAQ